MCGRPSFGCSLFLSLLLARFLLGWRATEDGLLPLVVHLWRQIANLHVHRLVLLELGRNGAQPILDLITGHGHIFSLNANYQKGVIKHFGVKLRLKYRASVQCVRVSVCLWGKGAIALFINLLGNMAKNVLAAAVGRNKTVSFGAAKGFHNTGHNWVLHGAR